MEISGAHRLDAPRQLVWEMLLDPETLRACMPGCERFEAVAKDTYAVLVRGGIPPLRGTYSGTVTVAEAVPGASYRLLLTGSGETSPLRGEAHVRLTGDALATLVRYTSSVESERAMLGLGNRLAAGAVRIMLGQFFRAMERRLPRQAP